MTRAGETFVNIYRNGTNKKERAISTKVETTKDSSEWKNYSLEQSNPFPEYPAWHWQAKEPSVSSQLALTWQGLDKHSLMSAKNNRIKKKWGISGKAEADKE